MWNFLKLEPVLDMLWYQMISYDDNLDHLLNDILFSMKFFIEMQLLKYVLKVILFCACLLCDILN